MLPEGKCLFFHTSQGNKRKSYLFTKPEKTIICKNPSGLAGALAEVQAAVDKGFYAAGFMAYEAGYSILPRAGKPREEAGPLLNFGIYKKPYVYNELDLNGNGGCENIRPSLTLKAYTNKFNRIKKLISAGEVYQVNECFKVSFKTDTDPQKLFESLCLRQKTEYSAYINDGKNIYMSFSPELFFKLDGRDITMKPMKGTLLKPCGRQALDRFKDCSKTSAENIMIVDLIRNDLGRICSVNSVKTSGLFDVEEFDTLYQMTSTVKGKLKQGTGLTEIMAAVFPSGSVTGAPKLRAMQVIRQTEDEDRGLYTGAIGFISPRMKKAIFSIPIRTAVIKGPKRGNGHRKRHSA